MDILEKQVYNNIDLDADNDKEKRHFELNLDPEYWKQKFLYPFALDLAPIRLDATSQKPGEIIAEKKRQKLLGDESILATSKYNFPVNQIRMIEYLHEIQKPITISQDMIQHDMYQYVAKFNKDIIPHIKSYKGVDGNNVVVDKIHNYAGNVDREPSLKETEVATSKDVLR